MPVYAPPDHQPTCTCSTTQQRSGCPTGHHSECHRPLVCHAAGCGHMGNYAAPGLTSTHRRFGSENAHQDGLRHTCDRYCPGQPITVGALLVPAHANPPAGPAVDALRRGIQALDAVQLPGREHQ